MGGGGAAHARHVVGWGLGVQVGRLERRLNGGAQVERQFRLAWADHGDDISRQYAGTGALKSGFTRTGKRGAGGLLDDGAKSAVRYLRNNFADGRRQDALDLLGGAYVPSKGAPILPSLCKPYPTPGRRLTTRRGRRADKPSPFKPQASPALPFAAALAALAWASLTAWRMALVRARRRLAPLVRARDRRADARARRVGARRASRAWRSRCCCRRRWRGRSCRRWCATAAPWSTARCCARTSRSSGDPPRGRADEV